MIWLRWLLFSALLLAGGYVVVGNWGLAVLYYTSGKTGSMVPLVGGVLATVGLLVAPAGPVQSLWWVPLVVDLGCVPLFAVTAVYLLWVGLTRPRQ